MVDPVAVLAYALYDAESTGRLSEHPAERFMLWVDAGNPHPGERD